MKSEFCETSLWTIFVVPKCSRWKSVLDPAGNCDINRGHEHFQERALRTERE